MDIILAIIHGQAQVLPADLSLRVSIIHIAISE